MVVVTARKRSCGKVMFLYLSVSHSVYGGGCLPLGPGGCTPIGQTPPKQTPPGQTPPRDRHLSRWYASY